MKEIARKLFVSLNVEYPSWKYGTPDFYVLKDGNFYDRIYAETEEEAIRKFKEVTR